MKAWIGAALIGVAALAAGSALARGWTTISLGSVASVEQCQDRAEAMFRRQGSTLQTIRAGTGVHAYGLRGLDVDAAVECAAANGGVTAVLALHTWTSDSALDQRRLEIAQELREMW